jgi:nucleoside-diphosphate-sugar epimerase
MSSILVTGAGGQLGSELVGVLREQTTSATVVALDLTSPTASDGPTETVDVRNQPAVARVGSTYEVDVIYHLASLLSATGEQDPDRAWDVNMNGLRNVLALARDRDTQVFWPSSIAVFGPSTPTPAPQQTTLDPATIYGVTKRSGELLCQYYHRRYGLDVRSLRLPGLISHETPPGGGTTDYAVEMYRHAARGADYRCFLRPDTPLPLMYMPDALRAICGLMAADAAALTVRDSYNIRGFTASPRQVATAIQQHEPSFTCTYAADRRQQIADTWPATVDDTAARRDWHWRPEYDLDATTDDMLAHLTTDEPERGGVDA